MRSILILLICIFCPCLVILAFTAKYNIHDYDKRADDYLVTLVEVRDTTHFFISMEEVLDTLTLDKDAEMYYWAILATNDTIYNVIQNWSFELFSDSNLQEQIYGAFVIKYKNNEKLIFLLNNCFPTANGETTNFMNEQFPKTDSIIPIHFEYNILPPDEYIVFTENLSRFIGKYTEDKWYDTQLIYKNR